MPHTPTRFKTGGAPQPQGHEVAEWYRESSPHAIDILYALAHMTAERDALLEALKGLVSAADYMQWPQEHAVWQKARAAIAQVEE